MQDDDSKERRCVNQRTDLVSLRGRCQIVCAVFGGTMLNVYTRGVFVGPDPMLIVSILGETCDLLVYDMASFESFQDANEMLVRFCGLNRWKGMILSGA